MTPSSNYRGRQLHLEFVTQVDAERENAIILIVAPESVRLYLSVAHIDKFKGTANVQLLGELMLHADGVTNLSIYGQISGTVSVRYW